MKRAYAFKIQLLLCTFLIFHHGSCDEEFDSPPADIDEVCDVCRCTNATLVDRKNITDIECVYKKGQERFIVNMLVWPESDNRDIIISFKNYDLLSIREFPESQRVLSIRMSNDGITNVWSTTFAKLTNLEELYLDGNMISEITQDTFRNLQTLQKLDLSENKLTDVGRVDFGKMKSLRSLDLSRNSMMKMPHLNQMAKLEELYLSGIGMFTLSAEDNYTIRRLKFLDLSHNSIETITKDMFDQAASLEYLNLSNNGLKNVDPYTFKTCTGLQRLDLSHNQLVRYNAFPQMVKVVNLHDNQLKDWPQFPESLIELDISQNKLYNIYKENEAIFENLQVLNISGNKLNDFEMTKPLPKVAVLDISYNLIQNMPNSINSNTLPTLEDLYMDGNPIKNLIFTNDVRLKTFSARYLNIARVQDHSIKLKPRNARDGSAECVNLYISHCDKLDTIEENAFTDLSICHLDVSYNKLTTLARIDSLPESLNLQGNPWNCNCSLQWVLDDYLTVLYLNYSSMLHDLRCEYPSRLRGLRLVHWYNWKTKPFCGDSQHMRYNERLQTLEVTTTSAGGFNVFSVVMIVGIMVIAIIIFSLVVYLIKGSCRQRQYMKRKTMRTRQTPLDYNSARMNGENTALTNL